MICSVKKPNNYLRIFIGIIILIIGFYFKSYWGLIGLVPIIFVGIGFCPLCIFERKNKN